LLSAMYFIKSLFIWEKPTILKKLYMSLMFLVLKKMFLFLKFS
jgi:hypothetical protein